MARVFRAYDPDINRTLAIKLLKSQLRMDSEYHSRFLREAKGAGVLSHPNIVTVFDVGEDRDHPYIAMELVEGKTLAELLSEKKVFATKDVVEIGIQLVRALDYAHKKGIVHRDVKPGNIMLVQDSTTIKVADFGICRIDGGDANDATQQTQIGNVLGTPHYMSPEQVLGEKVDSRSDLFSAGVVLYQLLTGHVPFQGDTLISVAYKITKSEAPSLDKLHPELPLSPAPRDRARAAQAAGEALPDRRGVRAGADRRRARVERSADDRPARRVARRALGADDGGAGGDHDDADRHGAVQAAVRGDARPGQGLRRVARQVHGHAECGAAPVGGLGGDGRVRAGDARPPAGLRLPQDRRSPGRRAGGEHGGAGQREVHPARGRHARPVERSGRHRRRATASPTAASCSTSRRPCCSRARRSAWSTSASTRRR